MMITRIETIHLADYANILFVAIHTDEGFIGYSDTFYMSDAVRGYLHQFAAPMLLGHDPLAIELHWKRLYEVVAHIAGKGAEIRALSAIDCALWDIFGQAMGMPVWQLLGGAVRDRIKTYNTCGGPGYGRPSRPLSSPPAARYEDLIGFMTRPGELAHELLGEGITGMKIWPFDYIAHEPGAWDDFRGYLGYFDPQRRTVGGQRLDTADLHRGLAPFRQIREAVGDAMDIMVEGHGLWSLAAAKRIAHALAEYEPFWLEDLMRADDIGALAELQASTSLSVLASEYLTTRYEYKPVLEQRAADMIMIDPTWAGGITESKKIATMAETFKRPVAMHDCTGPFTLFAGLHLALNATNAVYQETVRAYVRITYPEMVTEMVHIENGHILAPAAPGIGTTLLPDVRTRPDVSIVTSDL